MYIVIHTVDIYDIHLYIYIYIHIYIYMCVRCIHVGCCFSALCVCSLCVCVCGQSPLLASSVPARFSALEGTHGACLRVCVCGVCVCVVCAWLLQRPPAKSSTFWGLVEDTFISQKVNVSRSDPMCIHCVLCSFYALCAIDLCVYNAYACV